MKTALVTGASDGIGEQAARALRKAGWQVAVIGRNPERTARVARELGSLHYVADFSSLRQVRDLAVRLKQDFPRIDLLANNAGGMFKRQPLTEDGVEITFQVNHLAHFLLTNLLMERLKDSRAAVINTSSIAHRSLGLFYRDEDVARPRRYSQHLAYGNAKLANILFTTELHRRCHDQGISAAAFHPGFVATSFARDTNSPMRLVYHGMLRKVMRMLSPAQGADTLVWLAEGQAGIDWKPGGYYADRKPAKTSRKARDEALASALWEQSLALCAEFLPDRKGEEP